MLRACIKCTRRITDGVFAMANAVMELDRRQTELAQSSLLLAVVGYDQHGLLICGRRRLEGAVCANGGYDSCFVFLTWGGRDRLVRIGYSLGSRSQDMLV